MHSFRSPLCDAPCPFDPAQRCPLPQGHRGLHTVTLTWSSDAYADDDTLKLPPIRDSIGQRRRPPVPSIADLSDRAELLEAMGRELQRELRELRDGDDQADGEPRR